MIITFYNKDRVRHGARSHQIWLYFLRHLLFYVSFVSGIDLMFVYRTFTSSCPIKCCSFHVTLNRDSKPLPNSWSFVHASIWSSQQDHNDTYVVGSIGVITHCDVGMEACSDAVCTVITFHTVHLRLVTSRPDSRGGSAPRPRHHHIRIR